MNDSSGYFADLLFGSIPENHPTTKLPWQRRWRRRRLQKNIGDPAPEKRNKIEYPNPKDEKLAIRTPENQKNGNLDYWANIGSSCLVSSYLYLPINPFQGGVVSCNSVSYMYQISVATPGSAGRSCFGTYMCRSSYFRGRGHVTPSDVCNLINKSILYKFSG